VLLEVEMLDGALEEFFFRWHGSYQDINSAAEQMRIWMNFDGWAEGKQRPKADWPEKWFPVSPRFSQFC
jgi:hypothetical protein